MNGGGLVLFVVLFYAGALRELSQFAAVDVDGDLAAKMADFLLAQKLLDIFLTFCSNILQLLEILLSLQYSIKAK